MKKTRFYFLVILAVILLISMITLNNGKIGLPALYAHSACEGAVYTIDIVNAMDDAIEPGTCAGAAGPPGDAYADIGAWAGTAPLPIPTPVVLWTPTPIPQACDPVPAFGNSYMQVSWTGNVDGSVQSLALANVYFENQTGSDWTGYKYVRFNYYLNACLNFCTGSSISQTATLIDNNGVAVTADFAVPIDCEANGIWTDHYGASINWLRNHYDVIKGAYFNAAVVTQFIINAVGTDYTQSWPFSPPAGTGWDNAAKPYKSVLMYYDKLALGGIPSDTDQPIYNSPPNMTVETARQAGAPFVDGAWVHWDYLPPAQTTPSIPLTAFHIYRSIGPGNTGNPYVSVGVVAANVTGYVDTTCLGGNTYCYKILSCNQGPTGTFAGDRINTVNATYQEPLLSAVAEVCGNVQQVPSMTFTPTTGAPPCPGCPTETVTPTVTATFSTGLESAHVYPNPFNPNQGSKIFYVNNVGDGTKVFIYAMDGSLVKDGQVKGQGGEFTWDGRNKNGTKVVSGLYYLVLQDTSNKTKVFRVIICYKCDPVYHPGQ
jgi:hypothetical protein